MERLAPHDLPRSLGAVEMACRVTRTRTEPPTPNRQEHAVLREASTGLRALGIEIGQSILDYALV